MSAAGLDPTITADPSVHETVELVRACPYCTPKPSPTDVTFGDARAFAQRLASMVRPSVVRVRGGSSHTPCTGSGCPRCPHPQVPA